MAAVITLSEILDAIIIILVLVLIVLIYRRLLDSPAPGDRAAKKGQTTPQTQVRQVGPGQQYSIQFEEHVIALLEERHKLKTEEIETRRLHSAHKLTVRSANARLKPVLARLAQIDSELKASGIL